jgi:hypothetical protein
MPYVFDDPIDVDSDADTISWASVLRASGFDTFTATPTSANLRALVTDETGSGQLVFATSPTLSSPTLSGTVAGGVTFSTATQIFGTGTDVAGMSGTFGPRVQVSGATAGFAVRRDGFAEVGLQSGGAGGLLGTWSNHALGVYVNSAAHSTFNTDGTFSVGGVVVPTISSTDTLTNKTLSSPTLSGTVGGSVTASGAWTFATSGVPVIVNSTNSNALKIVMRDAGSDRGYLGADATYSTYIANASATILSRWTHTSGLFEHLFDMTVSGDLRINGGQLYFDGTTTYLNYSATNQIDIVTDNTTRIRVDATGLVTINNAMVVGTPTGGNKGTGTINAQAVYDDNTLLTCYIIEAWKHGSIDLAKWDALTPNRERQAVYETVATGETDDSGQPITEQVLVTEAWTEERQHTPARGFAQVAAARLDIDNFSQFVFDNERLPAFPAPDRWQDLYNGKMASGDLIQRLWETVEVMAVHSIEARKRELALIARVEALEAAQ